MTKAFFYSAVFAALLGLMPRPADAAEISCVNAQSLSSCSQIWIAGEIGPGDADVFALAVRQAGPYLKGVLLSSPGGSPQEAMKIGQMVKKHRLSTQAPSTVAGIGMLSLGRTVCRGEECVCASACFLIWAAGHERSGDKLGIHRPVYEFTSRQPDAAAGVYWKTRMMSRMLTLSGDLRGYLSGLSVPEKFIARITEARSEKMHWLTKEEAAEMNGQAQQAPVTAQPAPAAPAQPAAPQQAVPQV